MNDECGASEIRLENSFWRSTVLYAFAAQKMYVTAVHAHSFPPLWSARCLREWSRTSIRTASGATANGQGRRAVLRRSCIELRSSHWGGVLNMLCSARGERGGCSGCTAIPAGCSESHACPTPHPKCCPNSRSEIDSLRPDRPTAPERATVVVRPSPGRRSFFLGPSFYAIDGSQTSARDRRRDGLGTVFPPAPRSLHQRVHRIPHVRLGWLLRRRWSRRRVL
jgi:hypothetical protein